MTGTVIKNVNEFQGKHNFLAEEILQPMVNKTDPGRINMFVSQISQTVVLNKPERPRVFTRFENIFGAYTSAIKSLPQDAEIIGIFEKNPLQKIYALRMADGQLHIHHSKSYHHLTESFGYPLKPGVLTEEATIGSTIPANSEIQSWPCSDESGNFAYGVNLRTLYTNKDGKTYEDPIIISKSSAERLSHTAVHIVTVVLNGNDLTLNTYGTTDFHKGFPDVGEEIRDGKLLVRRRINHDSIIFDLSVNQLSKIRSDSDVVFFKTGKVVDIDVYSNIPPEELDKHSFNRQIIEYQNKWFEFREWFDDLFRATLDSGTGYSEDVAFWGNIVRDSRVSKWQHDRSEFEGVVIQFMIAESKPARFGSKLANRMGGKGVISEIREDHLMPVDEHGRPVDAIINCLGVWNRLNPSQLYESELNFIADIIALRMKPLNEADRVALMLDFYKHAHAPQHEWLVSNLNTELLTAMANEIAEGIEPFYIDQPPFFGNISPENLNALYEYFEIERVKVSGFEDPQIVGSNYYLKLRHEPSSKMSARSAKHLSIGGVPTKNSRGVRASTEHHSTTPIRLGEQELQNLLIANRPEELKRLLQIYATDDVSRENAIKELLTRTDPFSHETVQAVGSGSSRPVAGFKALIEAIGLSLETSEITLGENQDDNSENSNTENN